MIARLRLWLRRRASRARIRAAVVPRLRLLDAMRSNVSAFTSAEE